MFDAKRLIGREFRDHNVQQDLKHWPFKVVDVGDKPKIMVEFKSEEKTFTPEEISSMVILRTYVLGKGGIMSKDTGRFLLLQKIYSKSLSSEENLNFPSIIVNNLFKFFAQDSNVEYLSWKSKTLPVCSDIIPP